MLSVVIAIIGLVAPCAGAWIEMGPMPLKRQAALVAPCAGAWIEIAPGIWQWLRNRRRPLRGGVD